MTGVVVYAAARFHRDEAACAFCEAPATKVAFPYVDHRRKRPWPRSVWACDEHADDAAQRAEEISHPRAGRA
jgi:hypothetical protein